MFYTIQNEKLTAIVSDLGAELQSLVRKDTGRETIWEGRPEIWKGHSILLFPVVGKLKDDTYYLNGEKYTMNKHGFASRSVFAVEKQTEDGILFVLTDSEATKSYPFSFRLEVEFRLIGGSLKVTHRVTNTCDKTMYFSLGAHPGLRCEMGDKLYFPEDETAGAHRLTSAMLLTEENVETPIDDHYLTVTPDIFKNDALIFEGLRSDYVTLTHEGKPVATVEFGSAPCLGVWAKPGAPYVCVEPWFGVDDRASVSGNIEEKPLIQKLAPNACFRFPMTITPHM